MVGIISSVRPVFGRLAVIVAWTPVNGDVVELSGSSVPFDPLGEPHSVRLPTDLWREPKNFGCGPKAAVQPRERHNNGTAAG